MKLLLIFILMFSFNLFAQEGELDIVCVTNEENPRPFMAVKNMGLTENGDFILLVVVAPTEETTENYVGTIAFSSLKNIGQPMTPFVAFAKDSAEVDGGITNAVMLNIFENGDLVMLAYKGTVYFLTCN